MIRVQYFSLGIKIASPDKCVLKFFEKFELMFKPVIRKILQNLLIYHLFTTYSKSSVFKLIKIIKPE